MAAPHEQADERPSAPPDRAASGAGAVLARIPRLAEVPVRSWRIIALASSLAVTAALVLTLSLGASAPGGAPAPSPDGTDPATLTQQQQDALALAELVEPLRALPPVRVGAAEHAALVEALDTLGERARACCDASLDSARVAVEIAVEHAGSSTGSIGRQTYDAAAPSETRDALGAALAALDAATAVDARVGAVVQVVDLGAALAGAPAQDPAGGAGSPADAGGSPAGDPGDPGAGGPDSAGPAHGGRDHTATPLPVPPGVSGPATAPTEPSARPTDPVTTPPTTPPPSGGSEDGGGSPAPGEEPQATGTTETDGAPVAG